MKTIRKIYDTSFKTKAVELGNENSTKLGVKAKRLKTSWDNEFLLKILNF